MAARLVRVRLFARDLDKMREFYERILEFAVVTVEPRAVRFRTGPVEILLVADPPFASEEYRDFINQLKGNMRGMGSALHFDVEDVHAWFRHLIAKGLIPVDPERNRRLEEPANREGRLEFAVEDPEGYWLYFGSSQNPSDASLRGA